MKVAVFSTKSCDRTFLEAANVDRTQDLVFFEPRLNLETRVLGAGLTAAWVFVNYRLEAKTLLAIAQNGIR